jgi:hypothetical protein
MPKRQLAIQQLTSVKPGVTISFIPCEGGKTIGVGLVVPGTHVLTNIPQKFTIQVIYGFFSIGRLELSPAHRGTLLTGQEITISAREPASFKLVATP